MTPMKVLNRVCIAIVASFVLFGFLLPTLVSSSSTLAVLAGFGIIGGLIYWVARSIVLLITKRDVK